MKIAFIIPTFSKIGGVERVTSLIVNQLVKKYDITVIEYFSENMDVYKIDKNVKRIRIFSEVTSLKKGMWKATKIIRKSIKEKKYDIVIACGSIYFPLGVLTTVFNKTKLILWEHTHYLENNEVKLQKYCRRGWVEFSNAIITLTNGDKETYLKHTRNKNIFSIPNPLDSSIANRVEKPKSNSQNIISVGRLTEIKNLEDVVEVASIVLNRYPHLKWDIYGDGPDRRILENKINQKGLDGRLRLKGNTDNIYEVYTDYSIFVSTSRTEGFGLAILEAMAFGVIPVCYDVPYGPKEIITNNYDGVLVKFGQINELAQQISLLIECQDKQQSFSKHTQLKVKQFEIEEIIKQWENILTSVLKNNKSIYIKKE